MTKRSFLVLSTASVLAGCAQLASITGLGGPVAMGGPAASEGLQVSLPSLGAQAVALQTASIGNVVTWRTSDDATFSFDRGVIVSTRGLGDDLMGADAEQSIRAVNGGAGAWSPRINAYLDGEYQSFFITFQCRRSDTQADELNVGTGRQVVTRITETCVNDVRQIENTYWRNSNGSILKSRQWVSPGVGYVETERVSG